MALALCLEPPVRQRTWRVRFEDEVLRSGNFVGETSAKEGEIRAYLIDLLERGHVVVVAGVAMFMCGSLRSLQETSLATGQVPWQQELTAIETSTFSPSKQGSSPSQCMVPTSEPWGVMSMPAAARDATRGTRRVRTSGKLSVRIGAASRRSGRRKRRPEEGGRREGGEKPARKREAWPEARDACRTPPCFRPAGARKQVFVSAPSKKEVTIRTPNGLFCQSERA